MIVPVKMCASAGSFLVAADAAPDDVAATIVIAGWRERMQQFLTRVARGASDGNANGFRGGAGAAGVTGLDGGMHRKEYLYRSASEKSIEIDE